MNTSMPSRRSAVVRLALLCGLLPCAAQATATLPAPGALETPFEQTLALHGIEFRVSCRNDSSLNRLEITPKGLTIDNQAIEREVDGTVTGAEVADLDRDGSPELYVFITSAGSGSYGSLVAYAANRRKSLSEIHLPSMEDHPAAAALGYQGHDRFAVGRHHLIRRFPVYRSTDPQSAPTGGIRELQYRLTPGEAGWQLKLRRVVAR